MPAHPLQPPETLVRFDEAAQWLGLAPQTLWQLASQSEVDVQRVREGDEIRTLIRGTDLALLAKELEPLAGTVRGAAPRAADSKRAFEPKWITEHELPSRSRNRGVLAVGAPDDGLRGEKKELESELTRTRGELRAAKIALSARVLELDQVRTAADRNLSVRARELTDAQTDLERARRELVLAQSATARIEGELTNEHTKSTRLVKLVEDLERKLATQERRFVRLHQAACKRRQERLRFARDRNDLKRKLVKRDDEIRSLRTRIADRVEENADRARIAVLEWYERCNQRYMNRLEQKLADARRTLQEQSAPKQRPRRKR